jgi:hypothetical protein
MSTHELKCWPDFFDAVVRGEKPFEVRKNDRGYQRGDVLVLRKYDPIARFGGRHYMNEGDYVANAEDAEACTVHVTYVLSGFGIEPGFVAMGLSLRRDVGDTDPRVVIAGHGWATSRGGGLGQWEHSDEEGERDAVAWATDGNAVIGACGDADRYCFAPDELRAFAQLAEESEL